MLEALKKYFTPQGPDDEPRRVAFDPDEMLSTTRSIDVAMKDAFWQDIEKALILELESARDQLETLVDPDAIKFAQAMCQACRMMLELPEAMKQALAVNNQTQDTP